jgi:hypothetical protein
MDIFKGDKKEEEKAQTRLGEKVLVTRNRLTKIPVRVMKIDAFPTALKEGATPITEKNAEAVFKGFIREHKALLEVEADDLKMISAKKISNRWYVKYGQYYKGLLVLDATVGLESSENGKVNSYVANYQPDIDVPTEPKVTLEQAIAVAKKTYAENAVQKLVKKESNLLIYAEQTADKVVYHLAWKLLLVGEHFDPQIEKYFIIDAIDGKIIKSYPARFPGDQVTGTVRGEIYPAIPTDAVTTMPMRHEYVDIDYIGQITTNNAGVYVADTPWYWSMLFFVTKHATFKLEGPYARVQNYNGGTGYTETRHINTTSPCDFTWTASDRDHINVFYHMNFFHDWLKDTLGYSWVNMDGTGRFNAQVNYPDTNAYAGDPMLFGTDDFARCSDVIYHECSHNVLCYEYGDYIGWPEKYIEAYAMDEGFADYFSCACTNDSRHGEGYSAHPRDLNNNTPYAGKASYSSEGHTGGTIIAGAAWDLRQRLITNQGSVGATKADKLILEAHKILSTYPRKYYFSDPHESNLLSALYRAADTDNNLLNGFPYFSDIQAAFYKHNLLQAVLEEDDSYDFSTNNVGNVTGGDLYYHGGKFWANNLHQRGLTDLGDIGVSDLAGVNIPNSAYSRQGVTAVNGHTYMSMGQEGEMGGYIAFRITALSADKSKVTITYLYRFSPAWYVANTNTLEIHKLDCHWASLMLNSHKQYCQNLQEAANMIKNQGYNGCHYCLNRYDTDAHTLAQVIHNLDEDLV